MATSETSAPSSSADILAITRHLDYNTVQVPPILAKANDSVTFLIVIPSYWSSPS